MSDEQIARQLQMVEDDEVNYEQNRLGSKKGGPWFVTGF